MTRSVQHRALWLAGIFIMAVALGVVGFAVSRRFGHRAYMPATTTAIALAGDTATPTIVGIPVGQSVQFNSTDQETHNIGQGKGTDEVHQAMHLDEHDHAAEGKQSGDFGAGEAYRVAFNTVGTFYFHDHLHPKISVTVVVYQPTGK